ncbi:hypothetical protein TanjilG_08154 [Lupinus angustifolius]|uniref:Uncharacterized protein n=1 Tax=Lupinus angustifolius TaxID=3871 RepID=A0A1J7IAH6_LUPAN|nr:hypothetical protein TanjilG_08154 [Lupinus angustifolius]
MKRRCMVEEGVAKAMIMVINKSFKERKTTCLEEVIGVLRLLWNVATMVNNMTLLCWRKHGLHQLFDLDVETSSA